MGWLLLRDESKRNSYLLVAQRNLPTSWAKKMNKPLDDGVSSLVALSGETLSIHGKPLKRFKISALGKAVTVAPIKARDEVIALLIVVRKKENPIRENVEALLEAVADYASISLINARLFRALQQSSDASHSGEKRQNALMETLRGSLYEELRTASFSLDLLAEGKLGELKEEQKQALETARAALERLRRTTDKTTPIK